jgi:histidinol-phosphate aminotransferase
LAEKFSESYFRGLARPCVRDFKEYDAGPMPGEQFVLASANENSAEVPRCILEAVLKAAAEGNRYGEGSCLKLRERIAALHGLEPEAIMTGTGLDGVFTILGRAFLEPDDEVLFGEMTFSAYRDTAILSGASPVAVPMRDNLSLDSGGFIRAATDRTKMVFFCNPNNPTGSAAELSEIREMLDSLPKETIFVLDEAYIDFAEPPYESGIPLLGEYPNLVICRTFSKIYGLAGFRLGYAAAAPELIKYAAKAREVYCVSAIAAAAAEAALANTEFLRKSRETAIGERAKMAAFFDGIEVKHYPTQGNFILIELDNAREVRDRLLKHGIAVRLLTFRGKERYLRISAGQPPENRFIEREIRDILGKKKG